MGFKISTNVRDTECLAMQGVPFHWLPKAALVY